jgi:hypothetical protein
MAPWPGARRGRARRAGEPRAPFRFSPRAADHLAQRLSWLGLAAIPSSLMMGVTTHLTMDVASAPFLWVVPLALYLLTFIFAFQDRPWIPRWVGLFLQAASLGVCVALAAVRTPATSPCRWR